MKKWFVVFVGLFLCVAACASNDDDGADPFDGPGLGGDGGLPDAPGPRADARPVVDARPVGDGMSFDFGDGGFGDCTVDEDCDEGECCGEPFPGIGFKVCLEKAPDAGPGECMFSFP